jgi:hypothetical protein
MLACPHLGWVPACAVLPLPLLLLLLLRAEPQLQPRHRKHGVPVMAHNCCHVSTEMVMRLEMVLVVPLMQGLKQSIVFLEWVAEAVAWMQIACWLTSQASCHTA